MLYFQRKCDLADQIMSSSDIAIGPLRHCHHIRCAYCTFIQGSYYRLGTKADFFRNRVDYEALSKIAEEGKHYLQQAEALIFRAHLAALEVLWRSSHDGEDNDNNEATDTLRYQAKDRLQEVRVF